MPVDVTIALFIWGIVFSIALGFGLNYIPILIKHVNEKRKAHKVIFKDSLKLLRAIRKSGKDHLGIFEESNDSQKAVQEIYKFRWSNRYI